MADDITITLTWTEVLLAAQVGTMRNVGSLRRGWMPANSKPDDDNWTAHIEGAGGEMAVAKYFGMYWSGAVGNIHAADVGPLQVKTNCHRRADRMIIRKTDPDGCNYISVLSFLPRFIIAGWLPSHECKLEDYWADPVGGRPAWFVPRGVLRPMSELPPVDKINGTL